MKVLIVDEEPDVIKLITMSFRMQQPSWEVISAEDGPAALERVEREHILSVYRELGLAPEGADVDMRGLIYQPAPPSDLRWLLWVLAAASLVLTVPTTRPSRSTVHRSAISITSGPKFPALDEANRVGLLRLNFDDITEPGTPRSFTPALAAEILDFVAGVWGQIEVLLIHCDVGLSRSPAVAAALSRIYYGDDGPWFELDFPNRLVYDVLVETHSQRAQGRST